MDEPLPDSSSDDPFPSDDEPDEPCRIAVTIDDDLSHAPDTDWMAGKLVEAVAWLKLEAYELSVVIVDDARQTQLHQQFMDINTTTDVITFDLRDDPHESVEGEIYLCLDEARRRAEELGHDLDKELLLYAVHGLLHLLGYDDHDPADHQRMHAKEDELLTAIGVGAVYDRRQGEGHGA